MFAKCTAMAGDSAPCCPVFFCWTQNRTCEHGSRRYLNAKIFITPHKTLPRRLDPKVLASLLEDTTLQRFCPYSCSSLLSAEMLWVPHLAWAPSPPRSLLSQCQKSGKMNLRKAFNRGRRKSVLPFHEVFHIRLIWNMFRILP